MLISLVSAKGSPGVTTTTLALASQWPRTAVVIDADPFGGDIPAGIGRGSWPAQAGLTDVVVDTRVMDVETAMRRRVYQPVPHGPFVLAGFGCPGQAAGVPWPRLAPAFAQLTDADVLADCGRFAPTDGVAPLIGASDAVVLVTGSSLRAARSADRLAPILREILASKPGDPRLTIIVARPGSPYGGREIAEGCGLPLLGEMPSDPGAAAVWSDGTPPGRGFDRSPLQREAREIAESLQAETRLVVASMGGSR